MRSNRAGTRQSPHVAFEECACALLLIDVVNTLEFEGGERIARRAGPVVSRLVTLRERARASGVPVIYVNDNFGRWRSDFKAIVRRCVAGHARGREFSRALAPAEDDYFVLKPYNSGFYSTVLESLLQRMSARTLILTGIATDNCVLFTAHDAYLRGYRLFVPADCSVAETEAHHRQALDIIGRVMKADTRPSRGLRLGALAEQQGSSGGGGASASKSRGAVAGRR
jgi:nicotinamidase-related amidase